ncbi:hypothetical protein LguiA_002128 [Lonicera macranthoides]
MSPLTKLRSMYILLLNIYTSFFTEEVNAASIPVANIVLLREGKKSPMLMGPLIMKSSVVPGA